METLTGYDKARASREATKLKRLGQELRVRELKITRLTTAQQRTLERAFAEAKWVYNSIVADPQGWKNTKDVTRLDKDGKPVLERIWALHAHSKQNLHIQVKNSLKTLASLKKSGQKVGKLKFKSRVNSLEFSTGDVKLRGGNRAFIPNLGEVRVRGVQQLGDEIANVRLTRKPRGYYLQVSSLTAKQAAEAPKFEPIGLDFGIKTHITLSDGREWNAAVEEPERLRRLQRKLQRQIKGSNNYWRTRTALQKQHERVTNKRNELANQFVSELKGHSLVAFQDENLRGWKAQPGYGKVIHHSAMGRVKAKLRRLPQAVMLDRFVPTTQLCPSCGSLNKLTLSERQYSCACGYAEQRDIHAARNMLLLAAQFSPAERGGAPVERRASGTRLASGKFTSVKQETRSPSVIV